MLYDLYLFDHNVLHNCFWTLPMMILGVIMIVMAIVHKHNQKKREEKFNEQLEEKMYECAEKENFEAAIRYRNTISALDKLSEKQKELLRQFEQELNPGNVSSLGDDKGKGGFFGKKKR